MKYTNKIILILIIIIILIFVLNFYQRYLTLKKIKDAENLIMVEKPKPYEKIQNPVLIKGKAKGYFFFEATFPIKIIDENGNVLLTDYIETKDNWMTENFVSFEKYININFGKTKRGFIVFERANPSGLKENQFELYIPVYFP
ncbi:MAG: Gmad2 immunoglobulin-like domain-containing protein [Caldisericia bacterium]|nr:Gmad2 immunoglobulin-like domain-containing protein [Caldisericia bacterium]